MIEVKVQSLGLDRTSNTPVVILQEVEGTRVLPIWIGPGEASAIAMELAGMKFSRPLTHDLFASVIMGMGGTLQRVMITKVIDLFCVMRDRDYRDVDTLAPEYKQMEGWSSDADEDDPAAMLAGAFESQTGGEFTFGRSWDALEFERVGREAGEKFTADVAAADAAHLNEYVEARKSVGSPDDVSFENFIAKLKVNEGKLKAQYNCRAVRFRVVTKDNKVSLKPVPIFE